MYLTERDGTGIFFKNSPQVVGFGICLFWHIKCAKSLGFNSPVLLTILTIYYITYLSILLTIFTIRIPCPTHPELICIALYSLKGLDSTLIRHHRPNILLVPTAWLSLHFHNKIGLPLVIILESVSVSIKQKKPRDIVACRQKKLKVSSAYAGCLSHCTE